MKNLNKLADIARDNVGFLLLSITVIAIILLAAYASEAYIAKKTGYKGKDENLKVRRMTLIAMLSAISVVLMFFEFPLWFVPGFYKLDFSELPVIIGAFTLGPVAGVMIEFIKVVLNLLTDGTTTAFVGEFANFLVGCAFVVPASFIYFLRKCRKNAIIGLSVGTAITAIASGILNAYMLLPKYAEMMGKDLAYFISAGTEKNQYINNMSSFIFLGVVPFNLIKCVMVSVIAIVVYKKISHLLKG